MAQSVGELITYQGDKVKIGELVLFGMFGDRGMLVGGFEQDAMVAPIKTKDGVLVGFKEPVSVKSSFRKYLGDWKPTVAEQIVIAARRAEVIKADSLPIGLSVTKVKGGYEVIHTKSGNRLMPFAYPERELAVDFARRAGQVGVDWTRPFSELQKESERIADLIRGRGRKLGMFETVLGMPTTFPKESSQTPLLLNADARRFLEFIIRDHFTKAQKDEAVRIAEGAARVDGATEVAVRHLAEALQYIDAEGGLDAYIKSGRQPAMNKGRAEVVRNALIDVSGETSLRSIHDSRSTRSKESDERQSNADTIEPDDPRVERWSRDPGSMDIVGVDTPRKSKGKKVPKKTARKTRKSTRAETQVRGISRR